MKVPGEIVKVPGSFISVCEVEAVIGDRLLSSFYRVVIGEIYIDTWHCDRYDDDYLENIKYRVINKVMQELSPGSPLYKDQMKVF